MIKGVRNTERPGDIPGGEGHWVLESWRTRQVGVIGTPGRRDSTNKVSVPNMILSHGSLVAVGYRELSDKVGYATISPICWQEFADSP